MYVHLTIEDVQYLQANGENLFYKIRGSLAIYYNKRKFYMNDTDSFTEKFQ